MNRLVGRPPTVTDEELLQIEDSFMTAEHTQNLTVNTLTHTEQRKPISLWHDSPVTACAKYTSMHQERIHDRSLRSRGAGTDPAYKPTKADKLVQAALEIEAQTATDAGAFGLMARSLALASLPHGPSKELNYQRSNGDLRITMTGDPHYGLPYGTKPRLIIA